MELKEYQPPMTVAEQVKKLKSIGSNVQIAAVRRVGYHLEVEQA